MTNSPSNDNYNDDNVELISQIYQSAKKEQPPQNVDEHILNMAREHLNSPMIKARHSAQEWWKKRHYQGAIAASFLVACISYIFTPITQNHEMTQKDEPMISHATKTTAKVLRDYEQTSSLGKMHLQGETFDAKKQMAEIAAPISNVMTTSAIESRKLPTSNDLGSELSALIAQNNDALAHLLEIQQQIQMSHQQIMALNTGTKAHIKFMPDENEVNVNQANKPFLLNQYWQQHQKVKRNLENILAIDANFNIDKTYNNVLSAEEIKHFIEMKAERSMP